MHNQQPYIKIHPDDDVCVALQNLKAGSTILMDGTTFILSQNVQAKHKFTINDLIKGQTLKMYGIVVGTAELDLPKNTSFFVNYLYNNTSFYLY